MQIDRYNLPKHFNTISDKLLRASFVSFDCQFTGLVTNLQKIQGKFADHQQFYQRIKQTALNFKILQFGLTAFIYNQKDKYYEPFAYNFYTLPYVNLPGFNNIMISQVDSLAFLSQHGINWSRIFKNGIIPQRLIKPFKYQHHQYDKYQQNDYQYFFNNEDKKTIDEIQNALEKLSLNKNQQLTDFKKSSIYNHFLSKYLDKLVLRKGKRTKQKFQFLTSFVGSINSQQQDDIIFEKQQKKVKYIEKKVEDIKMQQQKETPSIQALLKIVSDRQIPIVGHFPSLDIGLVYHTYFDQLPEKYQQFTDKINKIFPFIFDTKVLSRRVANNFKGMKVSLGSLYGACQDPKLLKNYCNVRQDKQAKENDNRHEAGYDSYLTGYVFVGMANWINKNDKGYPVNFNQLKDLNGLIYSRDTGQVSLRYPYCTVTFEYQRKVLILNEPRTSKICKQIAQNLSNYGTLFITEDHEQTYFVFEEQKQKMESILAQLREKYGLKGYNQRKITKARDTYNRSQQQLYYNSK